jgi:hypothetical protein
VHGLQKGRPEKRKKQWTINMAENTDLPLKKRRKPSESPVIQELAVLSELSRKRGPHGPRKEPRREPISGRIDARLVEAVKSRAAKQHLSLTDAIEQGLYLYLAEEKGEAPTQLRFMVGALPLPVQKRLLGCIAFLVSEELNPSEGNTRTWMNRHFDLFVQDDRAERALRLIAQHKIAQPEA